MQENTIEIFICEVAVIWLNNENGVNELGEETTPYLSKACRGLISYCLYRTQSWQF